MDEKTIARFWSKVDRRGDDDCWKWIGGSWHPFGYGLLAIDGINTGAHRVAWIIAHGTIPKTKHVLHRCDNPPCVNPAHLFLGSHTDNMRDKTSKWRHRYGSKHENAKLTESAVRHIRAERAAGVTLRELAAQYGVALTTIWHAARGTKAWRHV